MRRRYRYVGSGDLASLLARLSRREQIEKREDVLRWLRPDGRMLPYKVTITATYIIDTEGKLWLADQRSEHVACALGQDVLAAGEITVCAEGEHVYVLAVSNQSTGYCPKPESWWAIGEALDHLEVPHPSSFTSVFIVRHCDACGMTNIVKDGRYECAVCGSTLSREWNFR